MGHNFVLLDRTINTGNVQASFLDKASMEASHDYVPPGDETVLVHARGAIYCCARSVTGRKSISKK